MTAAGDNEIFNESSSVMWMPRLNRVTENIRTDKTQKFYYSTAM